jgi:phosphate transport system protein
MDRHIDDELQKFNQYLLQMAALTESAIHRSIEALKSRNSAQANAVITDDEKLDDLEIVIDEQAMHILALFQPMAKDLRFVITGMRVNSDLERIADLAVNICQRVIEIADKPLLKPLDDIPRLAGIAQKMVQQAIDAFINRDEDVAKSVIYSDQEANALRSKIMKELVYDYMVKDGAAAPRAVALLLVARDLERICDLATHVAEEVIYMIQAKIVKHHLDQLSQITKTPPTDPTFLK